MSIAQTVVKRPTTFLILYALLVGLGLYIVPRVPVDLFPEITPPTLVISTLYAGAGPEEVEKSVTRVMEGVLTNVSGVKEITSTSSEGASQFQLSFGWGLDLAEATNDVRDALESVKGLLPEEATTPLIFKFNVSLIPVLQISIDGNRSVDDLYAIADDQIKPLLEQVEGVSLVSLQGGRERAVRIEVSQNRLEAYGMTLSQLTRAIAAQNIQIGAGTVYEGTFRYLVETKGEFESIDDIRNSVITYTGLPGSPRPVRLSEIADVTNSYKDTSSGTYVNGKPGVYLAVQKQSGTNAVQVVDNIQSQLENIKTALPPGIDLVVVYDTTKIIRQSLAGVTSSALLGIALAMLVLLFFLRNIKSTIIIGVSIPISLIIAIMAMYFFGLTLNIMTLAGLTLGIGMIVDSSIVILENIYRYREKGSKSGPAAHLGSQEMITAITASTLTTVSIFVPMLIFSRDLEIIGVLFKDLSFTIIVALLSSLLIAVSLVPVLSSKYLRIFTRKQRPISLPVLAKLDERMSSSFRRFDDAYTRLLARVLDHKGWTMLIIVAVFLVSVFVLKPLGGNVGVSLTPDQAQDSIQISLTMPVGTRYKVTEDVINQLAEISSRELKGYKDIFSLVGSTPTFVSSDNTYQATLWVTLPPESEQIDSYSTMVKKIRSYFDDFPSARFRIDRQGFGGGNASPIDVVLRTEDLDKARTVANEIRELLKNQVDEIVDPQISLADGLPVAGVVLDRDKAYSLGLDISTVANEISIAIDGKVAGRYRSGGEEIDILVILNEEDRSSIPDLTQIFVLSRTGERIPISSIAQVERSTGPVSIEREDRTRVVHVKARLNSGVSLGEAENAVRQAIDQNIVLDDDIILTYSGDYRDLQKYSASFLGIIILALALVYGIMASLFESLKDPFIIFISIFMIIPGILLMYGFMNLPIFSLATPLSMFSAVGMLMLIGISVNNGIVLVDYSNLLRDRGFKIRDAALEAAGNRLRPILMTSLTTILGMVPLAFRGSEGSELVRPIGQTIIGGMIMSTLMSLFLVPLLYAGMNRKYDAKRGMAVASDSPKGRSDGGGDVSSEPAALPPEEKEQKGDPQ